METISAKIYHGLTRDRCRAIALIENLQREDINCMEKAEGYAGLMAAENLTQEQCAERVGKERSTVANALRLLRLPEKIRGYLREGVLTAGHGIALARFVPKEDEVSAVPKWEQIVGIMAEEAVKHKTTAGDLEVGIPSIYSLRNAGLIVRIDAHGEHRIPEKLKRPRHPAYFPTGDGDWVCFDPPHWDALVQIREREKKANAEKEKAAREEELAKLAKKGKKQLSLSDLDREHYREFEGANAGLVDLVPEDKRAAAKDGSRRTTVVTDVELADRLKGAMQRAIKKNRKESAVLLEEKVIKAISSLKKCGPHEFAWLVFLLVDIETTYSPLHLRADVAKKAGVKLPKHAAAPAEMETIDPDYNDKSRLCALEKSHAPDVMRVLMMERLPSALADVIESGPDSLGGLFIKWWLDTDTLWLLEESEEGRAELIESVKESAWYQKTIAGEKPAEGDEP